MPIFVVLERARCYNAGMKIRTMLAVCACKLSRFAIRLLGGNGTDFPGRVALRLCPDLLGELARSVTTIVITGTNGKTTTVRMTEQVLADSEISYFANRSGANLLPGITAEYAVHAGLTGKSRFTHAVIEADEATFKYVAKYTDPAVVIVTNLFRDQLDRYGAVTGTLAELRRGVENSPHAVLCLNGDDSLSASLAENVPNEVIYYGVDTPIYATEAEEVSDAPFCESCGAAFVYDYITYGHLGGYRCPVCGRARPRPRVSVREVEALTDSGSRVILRTDGTDHAAQIGIAGGFNLYNACAAVSAGLALCLPPETAVGALAHFSVGFGRMETFTLEQTPACMSLVKNPAGINQNIRFLRETLNEEACLVFCLTDKVSDGTDISWIWDVEFEGLAELSDRIVGMIFGGNRAEELALRAKYAGLDPERTQICKDNEELLRLVAQQKKKTYIFPTYNAMVDLRELLTKKCGLSAFWE